jgi:adiponectin receptor
MNELYRNVAPSLLDTKSVLSAISVWPLACNTFAAVFCMGCSAVFHLMYVRSENTQKMLSRLDYGGISVLIFGTTIPVIIYAFPCQQS